MITPWDTRALDERRVWDATGVRCLAAAPDGRSLWAALADRVVCWEVPTGREVAVLDAPGVTHLAIGDGAVVTGGAERLRWARDGDRWRRIAREPIAGDRVIALTERATLSVDLRGHAYRDDHPRRVETAFDFVHAALREDGSAAVAGQRPGNDDRLLVFDGAGEEATRAPLGPGIAALAWCGDDVVVGDRRALRRYAPRRRKVVWSRPTGAVAALGRSPRGDVLVALCAGGALATSATEVMFLRASDGAPLGVWTLSPDAVRWAQGGDARVVDVGARVGASAVSPAPLAVAPDGSWCALRCSEGVLILGVDGKVVAAPRHGLGAVRTAEWTADGRLVVAYDNTPAVHVLRPGAPSFDRTFEHDGAATWELYPSPDGRAVVVHARGVGDAGLRLLLLDEGAPVALGGDDLARVEWVEWSGGGDALWVACRTRRSEQCTAFDLWRVDASHGAARRVWQREWTEDGTTWFRLLHRAGDALYAALPRACLRLDPATGGVREERPWPAAPFAFLDDARVLLWDGRCFDVARGVLVRDAPRDLGAWEDVRVVSPSRAWALSVPHGRAPTGAQPVTPTLCARATANGALLATFDLPAEGRARSSQDGRGLAVVHHGALRLYRVDADALDEAARRAAR